MEAREFVYGLDLDDDRLFDDNVEAIASVIDNRQGDLCSRGYAAPRKFVSEAVLVDRLQQSGPSVR